MGWHGPSATEGNTKSKGNSELCHGHSPDPSWDNQCLWDTRDALRCCLYWDGQNSAPAPHKRDRDFAPLPRTRQHLLGQPG